MATCVINAFPNIPPHLVNVPDFWLHSIACGITSGLLAERCHDPAPERFFVGGLLHDIGRLLMYLKAPQLSSEMLRRAESINAAPCVLERQVFGFDHAELGGELLALWRLPASLVQVVGSHHHTLRGRHDHEDAIVVQCADFLITTLEIGNSGETSVSPISEEACNLCLPASPDLAPLIEEIEARCEHLYPILMHSA